MHVLSELISTFNCVCHTFTCSCFGEAIKPSVFPSLWPVSLYLSGVPGFQCAGPVCHQIHAKRDVQSAAVSTEVTAVCHGRCGRAEQPCTVSTAIWHRLNCAYATTPSMLCRGLGQLLADPHAPKCIGELVSKRFFFHTWTAQAGPCWLARLWLAGRSLLQSYTRTK